MTDYEKYKEEKKNLDKNDRNYLYENIRLYKKYEDAVLEKVHNDRKKELLNIKNKG